jgi:hypothetical protein
MGTQKESCPGKQLQPKDEAVPGEARGLLRPALQGINAGETRLGGQQQPDAMLQVMMGSVFHRVLLNTAQPLCHSMAQKPVRDWSAA